MTTLVFWVVLATVFLIALIAVRPSLTTARGWRILAFVAFFLLPVMATVAGVATHLEHSKSTEFCMSCHEMQPYGKSLLIDDPERLPAAHYQNRRVDREFACYTCHTDYTMFGDVNSKLRGLKHVWVHYLGDVPPPGEIALYTPYNNRECLHCHAGARSFTENVMHEDVLAELESGEMSCLDCHTETHTAGEVEEYDKWKPAHELELEFLETSDAGVPTEVPDEEVES